MKNLTLSNLTFILAFLLPASVNAQSVVTGTLLGYDGNPIKKSLVLMTVGGPEEGTITIEPDEDGRFHYKTDYKGLHFLNFVGVHHLQQKVVLYVAEPREIHLNVRLTPIDYKEDLSRAELRGRTGKDSFYGKRFEKQPDGTFAVEFPSDEPSVHYLIIRATESGEPIPGVNADDYLINAYGGMFAAIYGINKAVNGKVKVILDPRNRTKHQDTSPFADSKSLDAQLTRIYGEINEQNKYVTPDRATIQGITAEISVEKDTLLRHALLIKYLNMLFPFPGWKVDVPGDLIESKTIAIALNELTPNSPFWMLRWLSPDDLVRKAVAGTGQPDRYEHYAERSIENWPYGIRGWGFSGLMAEASEKGDSNEVDRLYEKLQKLSPDSEGAKYEKLQRERKAAAKVVAGSQVPAFRAHSLGDSTVVYTPENIGARLYLVDFWATWCGPCYREFPYLHQAYEKFRDKGFEILSYAIDPGTEAITRSRKAQFPMPWLHAIDPQFRTNDSEMVKQFEVYGIPACFLIDASGKILATTEDLRGEKLLEVLNKYFKDQ